MGCFVAETAKKHVNVIFCVAVFGRQAAAGQSFGAVCGLRRAPWKLLHGDRRARAFRRGKTWSPRQFCQGLQGKIDQ